MERTIVKKAIESMKGGFNCMPIPVYRDPSYQFEAETMEMVSAAGFQLKWLDTFKGGCWHVIPI